jgi:hypothetical protein
MFTAANMIRVIREGGPAGSYNSWAEALPNIRVGDELRGFFPDGTTKCADVIEHDFPEVGGALVWKPILRPCSPP